VDRLASFHIQRAAFEFNPQHTIQYDGKLVEFRALAGFLPTARRPHMGDGNPGVA